MREGETGSPQSPLAQRASEEDCKRMIRAWSVEEELHKQTTLDKLHKLTNIGPAKWANDREVEKREKETDRKRKERERKAKQKVVTTEHVASQKKTTAAKESKDAITKQFDKKQKRAEEEERNMHLRLLSEREVELRRMEVEYHREKEQMQRRQKEQEQELQYLRARRNDEEREGHNESQVVQPQKEHPHTTHTHHGHMMRMADGDRRHREEREGSNESRVVQPEQQRPRHSYAHNGDMRMAPDAPSCDRGGENKASGRETYTEMRQRIFEEEQESFMAQLHHSDEYVLRQEIRDALRRQMRVCSMIPTPTSQHRPWRESVDPSLERGHVRSVQARDVAQQERLVNMLYGDVDELRHKIARLEGEQRVERSVIKEGELEAARLQLRDLQRELAQSRQSLSTLHWA